MWRTRFGRGYVPAVEQTTAELIAVPPSRCVIGASRSTVSSASARTYSHEARCIQTAKCEDL